MNFAKKILPIIIAAIVFGIAGYFIGTGVTTRNLGASVYGVNEKTTASAALNSWDCKKNPEKPGCKGGVVAAPDDSIQMASAMCQKFPNDPRCKGGFAKPAEKAAMVSWFCQNNPKDPRCSQNVIGNPNIGNDQVITSAANATLEFLKTATVVSNATLSTVDVSKEGSVTLSWCILNGGQWLGHGHCFIPAVTAGTDSQKPSSLDWKTCIGLGGTIVNDSKGNYIGCYFLQQSQKPLSK
jgi:hypothetical protein